MYDSWASSGGAPGGRAVMFRAVDDPQILWASTPTVTASPLPGGQDLKSRAAQLTRCYSSARNGKTIQAGGSGVRVFCIFRMIASAPSRTATEGNGIMTEDVTNHSTQYPLTRRSFLQGGPGGLGVIQSLGV